MCVSEASRVSLGLTFVQDPAIHQRIFELDFEVDELRASLAKTGEDGIENSLGNVSFKDFALKFGLAKFDMRVDVHLGLVKAI